MEIHLHEELLPFWLDRVWDSQWGGYLTQWDADGKDSGVDEKSLLAHMRTIYSLSLACSLHHDLDGRCAKLAKNLTLTAEIRKKACNLFRSKLLLLHENNRNMVG